MLPVCPVTRIVSADVACTKCMRYKSVCITLYTGCVKKTRRVPTAVSRCAAVVGSWSRRLSCDITASASTIGAATSSVRRVPRPCRSTAVDKSTLTVQFAVSTARGCRSSLYKSATTTNRCVGITHPDIVDCRSCIRQTDAAELGANDPDHSFEWNKTVGLLGQTISSHCLVMSVPLCVHLSDAVLSRNMGVPSIASKTRKPCCLAPLEI